MGNTQSWILVVEVGVIAVAYFATLIRGGNPPR
jgi:hypothetical protein